MTVKLKSIEEGFRRKEEGLKSQRIGLKTNL